MQPLTGATSAPHPCVNPPSAPAPPIPRPILLLRMSPTHVLLRWCPGFARVAEEGGDGGGSGDDSGRVAKRQVVASAEDDQPTAGAGSGAGAGAGAGSEEPAPTTTDAGVGSPSAAAAAAAVGGDGGASAAYADYSVAAPSAGLPTFADGSAPFTIKLLIPSASAGGVIGKSGENISNIRKLTGCRVSVGDATATSDREVGVCFRCAQGSVA